MVLVQASALNRLSQLPMEPNININWQKPIQRL